MSLRKLLLYIFVIGTASAVILPTITNQKEPIESNISIQISQSEVNSCLNRISEKTGYDRTRLNHIGNDGESIVVTYLNDFGNLDIDWEVNFKFKVNEYIRATMGSHLKYDNDVKTAIIDEDMPDEIVEKGAKLQWKQLLGIGISVDF